MKTIKSSSADRTIRVGFSLGRLLFPGAVILLTGDLGSGKTTLVKGIASSLGEKGDFTVNSPSFVLVKEYPGRINLYHLDLYRLGEGQISLLGLEEYLYGDSVAVVEWGEKLGKNIPAERLKIHLAVSAGDERVISFYPEGKKHAAMAEKLLKDEHTGD